MISIDAKEIEKAKSLLKNYPQQVIAAAASAINRTSAMVKTEVSKTIRKNYLISAKDIKSTLSIKRASRLKLTGMISSLKGYVGAMQRKNLSMRYPLRIPHGPSVPQMFSADRSMSVIAPFAEKTLNQRFLHEVSYRYGKFGGR